MNERRDPTLMTLIIYLETGNITQTVRQKVMHFITLCSFLTEKGKSEVLDIVKLRYKELC